MAETLIIPSFETVHKTAYSHGLEAIYTLETVDPKSIRALRSIPPIVKKETSLPPLLEEEPFEESLDLGPSTRDWIYSFVPLEPISVIGISRHAEKCLQSHGKMVLGDLIGKDLSSFVYFKGMGQGHLDEISQKLERYLEGKSIQKTRRIDFDCWIRSLTKGLDLKKCYCLLERYGLQEIVYLSLQEKTEMRRLTLEMRSEWSEEVLKDFRKEEKAKAVTKTWEEILEVFIRPWIFARLGMATESELLERICEVSLHFEKTKQALSFFQDVYLENGYKNLSFEEAIYFSDADSYAAYQKALAFAKSYFYSPFTSHPLDQLIDLIEKEASLTWTAFKKGFIKKVLKLSPHFSIRKTPTGPVVERR